MTDSSHLQIVRTIILLCGLMFGHLAVAVEQQHTASAPGFPGFFDNFGTTVSISGEWLAVGAPLDDGTADAYQDTGTVYMFRREGLQWTLVQILNGDLVANAHFGTDVALGLSPTGPILVVGASRDNQNGTNAGAVYVFHYGLFCSFLGVPINCWDSKAKLIGSEVGTGDRFGVSVDVDNETIIVGAYIDEVSGGTADTGAAYVYQCVEYFFDGSGYCSGWDEQAQLLASTPDVGDFFGVAVAVSGDTVAIGAQLDDDNGANAGAVSVYHYEVVGNTGFPFFDDIFDWVLEQKITAEATAQSSFGVAVDLAGDDLVVGAYLGGAGESGSGSAFVYDRDAASTWSLAQTLIPRKADNITSDVGAGDRFGFSVAINVGTYPGIGDTILIGAFGNDDNGLDSGSAYWYQRNGSSWDQIQKLTASDGEAGDAFGSATALSPGIAVVGAVLDDLPLGDPEFPLQDAGSAYSFSDPASTAVTLVLSANSIQINSPVTATVTLAVSGINTPSSQLNGQTVSLAITAPGGAGTTTYPGTTDDYGVATFSGLTDFTSAGTYTVKASFAATTDWSASSSATESVVVGSRPGYAVIIEGSLFATGSPDELGNDKSASRIYQTLRDRGWSRGQIYYFGQDDAGFDVDAVATFTNIDYELVSNDPDDGFRSLLEKTTGSQGPPRPGPIHFFLVGQADTGGVFYLNPDNGPGGVPEELSSAQIDAWLDTLEADPAVQAFPRTVIIGSPNSGDFIPGLSGPANPSGRVIVTSAAAGGNAVKGHEEQDGLPAASYFVGELMREWGRGVDLRQSYMTARDRTEVVSRIDDSSLTAQQQYVDNYLQRPQLEDSGDGTGTHILSNGSIGGIPPDGAVAEDVYLGFGGTQPANGFDVTGTQTLPGPQTIPLTVNVADFTLPNDQWTVAIRAPGVSLPTTGSVTQIALPYARVNMMGGDGIFTVSPNFSQAGKHEIWYWGETTGSGEITITKRSIVYVNSATNQQPGSFMPKLPVNGEPAVVTKPMLDWEQAADPDGDAVTYSIIISTSDSTTNGVLDQIYYQADDITSSLFFVPADAGLLFGTTYFWQVRAVDRLGSIRDGLINWFGVLPPPRDEGSYASIIGEVNYPITNGVAAVEGAIVSWTPKTTGSVVTSLPADGTATDGRYALYGVLADPDTMIRGDLVANAGTSFNPGGEFNWSHSAPSASAGDLVEQDLTLVPIDTDGDGILNIVDVDDDNDGLVDGNDGDAPVPVSAYPEGVDADGNDIVDTETEHGTDPLLADTDGDTFTDGDEVLAGSDPLEYIDTPCTGDVNGDGNKDAADVLLTQRAALGVYTPEADEFIRMNCAPLVNGNPSPDPADNEIGANDVLLIQRWVLGF